MTTATVPDTESATNVMELWIFRGLWLILPFTAGPLLSRALEDAGRPLEIGGTLTLWVVWAALLIASMVPRTETLTAARIIAPANLAAVIVAVISLLDEGTIDVVLIAAIISSAAAAMMIFRPQVSDAFVDGSSYGDERRYLLSTPGAIMLGPIQLVWATITFGATLGPFLLLSERWISGGIATVIGLPLAYFAVPVLHRLSFRWLVFVPAGMVVHDKTALREPQLFRKESITAFGPASVDTTYEDLSLGASGLALRTELIEPTKIVKNERGADADLTDIGGFLVSPNRPGRVIAEAKERGYPIA